MASRNKDKAQIAINELKEDTGNEAIFLPLDLASLASVRKGAEEFLRLAEWLFRLFCRNLIKVLFQQRARAPYIVQQWASGHKIAAKYPDLMDIPSGIMWPSIGLVTEDGYDLQFGTNVIGVLSDQSA
jgi:retinol dehydrogenase-12